MSVRTQDRPVEALEALAAEAPALLEVAILEAVDLGRLADATPRDTGELARSWRVVSDGVENVAGHASYALDSSIEAALPTGDEVEARFAIAATRLQEDRC